MLLGHKRQLSMRQGLRVHFPLTKLYLKLQSTQVYDKFEHFSHPSNLQVELNLFFMHFPNGSTI